MFRKIVKADKKAYLKMASEFYSSEAVLFNVPQSHFENTFEQLTNNSPYAEGYIFEKNGETAGFAVLAKTWSTEAGGLVVWVEEIYILPQFQGNGLAGEFFSYLSKLPDIARIRLEAEPENENAIRLYKRLGFKELPYTQYIIEK